MYAVIMAGGSGTRLWPLSRESLAKQYLRLTGSGYSLFQEAVLRLRSVIAEERMMVVAHRDQQSHLRRQLKEIGLRKAVLLPEPLARNTAPAVALTTWCLVKRAGLDSILAVLPSDHLIPDAEALAGLLVSGEKSAQRYGLVAFGIKPTYPATGYGYICRGEPLDSRTFRVAKFVEKPPAEKAACYVSDPRYFWNSGMFVFRAGTLVEEFRRHLPKVAAAMDTLDTEGFTNLDEVYSCLDAVSIDYGIMEKSNQVAVVPASLEWSDLGSWEALYRFLPRDNRGNHLRGRVKTLDTRNCLIMAEKRLVAAVGVENLVVVDSGDALLVCARDRSQEVRAVVDELKKEEAPEYRIHSTEYRPWGSFTVLEKGETFQVKRITVDPGQRLSLQSHRRRAEHWVVVKGRARVTVNEEELVLQPGERVYIPVQARHRLENPGKDSLEVIEIQIGDYLEEDDIQRYEDDYGREKSDAAFLRSYRAWLEHDGLDEQTRRELLALEGDTAAIRERFSRELCFGTGGLRGVMGAGLSRMNRYTVRRAAQGLADYINQNRSGGASGPPQVAVAFDTRRYSREFAEDTALVLAANNIRALLFEEPRPTPELSFAVRELGCAAGVVITASHNPPQYNGFKVYGPDGGQAVSPLVDRLMEAIAAVDILEGVKIITRSEALEKDLLKAPGSEVDDLYLQKIRALSVSRPRVNLKVVYTALHGTGAALIPSLLAQTGFVELSVVEEQMRPDPDFATIKVPNPEEKESFALALDLARRQGAHLVLATDPDGDRIGCAVREDSGEYCLLTGNQVGALLLDYLLGRLQEKGELPANGVIIKTIVTSDLGKEIAQAYGIRTLETLTGFKYIGERIKEFERHGRYRFLFGYEESYGYLAGTFVRDKDAIMTAWLLAEMTAYHLERGNTLTAVLEQLYRRHGYFREDLFSLELRDLSEAERVMARYIEYFPGVKWLKPVEKRDYQQGRSIDLLTGTETRLDLPVSKVLYYRYDDGSWFCVRPSGTEPKIKFYFSVRGDGKEEAEEKLARLKEAVLTAPKA